MSRRHVSLLAAAGMIGFVAAYVIAAGAPAVPRIQFSLVAGLLVAAAVAAVLLRRPPGRGSLLDGLTAAQRHDLVVKTRCFAAFFLGLWLTWNIGIRPRLPFKGHPLRGFVVGLICLLVAAVLTKVCFRLWQLHVGRRHRAADLQADGSRELIVGTEKTITWDLQIRNSGRSTWRVWNVCIDSSAELDLMRGLQVVRTSPPAPKSRIIDDNHHFAISLDIGPHASGVIRFDLKGIMPGTFRGFVFVDVHEVTSKAFPELSRSELKHLPPHPLQATVT